MSMFFNVYLKEDGTYHFGGSHQSKARARRCRDNHCGKCIGTIDRRYDQ